MEPSARVECDLGAVALLGARRKLADRIEGRPALTAVAGDVKGAAEVRSVQAAGQGHKRGSPGSATTVGELFAGLTNWSIGVTGVSTAASALAGPPCNSAAKRATPVTRRITLTTA